MVNEDTAAALVAAFSPFGSLTMGVDAEALASAMNDYVSTGNHNVAGEIVRLVQEAKTDDSCGVYFGERLVELVTPTSSTRISRTRSEVRVYFGEEGSENRALQILEAGELANVRFTAYEVSGSVIDHLRVIVALVETKESHIAWLEGPNCGRNPQLKEGQLRKAKADLEVLKSRVY